MQLKQDRAPWLAFEGRWGSTVEAPALQEWFAKAENPVSRSWLAQVGGLMTGSPPCLISPTPIPLLPPSPMTGPPMMLPPRPDIMTVTAVVPEHATV